MKGDDTLKFLGDKLYELRHSQNLSQEDIASKFYVKKNTWCQYERNIRRPDIDLLKQIANYFNISIDYLLGTTEIKYDPKDPILTNIISIYQELSNTEKQNFIKHIETFK